MLYYVGLGEARYRTVDTYSTGMKQRVKLAQALVHDPDLLLLDEPTNGLDPQGREEMLTLIHDVATRRQMSLILCSHLLRDVERVCERRDRAQPGRRWPRRARSASSRAPRAAGLRRALQGRRRAPCSPTSRTSGGEWREGEDGVPRLPARGPRAGDALLTARECGVQVRHLRPGAETLEDVFLRALGHEVQA